MFPLTGMGKFNRDVIHVQSFHKMLYFKFSKRGTESNISATREPARIYLCYQWRQADKNIRYVLKL